MESIRILIENYSLAIKIIVVVAGYFFTFGITTYLIKKIVIDDKTSNETGSQEKVLDKRTIRESYIIGKCENIIILSLVLVGEVTGLALIFAAKNLVSRKDVERNPGFFRTGTMVNFTTSLVIAYGLKFLLQLIP